ncbi:sugar-transfer associated ATP-grasp domain-containing protein [Sphingosinicella soli]|uniref:Alpha-L-glutamate ligase-related protein ATP-grasp domain-containing protein n=1 Tax=Sphingosinicella soli TaxID=333708 RepID=A0A7W7B246_9SPHN|nr:sugar-transfer associated ATP-grasp domain-containing protein [Sphingosinicella soli]MBB4632620.1 hypothetical protein [Sphingosinicella soli]
MNLGLPLDQIVKSARKAKAQSGRGIIAQIWDMIRLRIYGHGITADLYYDLRLFEPRLSWRQKTEYVGSWIKPKLYRVQGSDAVALFNDKLKAAAFFQENGIPSPPVLAATHAPAVAGVVSLNSPGQLKAWLMEQAPYPVFSKPAVSYRGYGNILIRSLDRAGGTLVYGNGHSSSIDDFADLHGAPGKPTLIFQDVLRPHPDMQSLIGDRIATARFMVLNDRPKPELYRVGLRIPAGTSMVDNFRGGASGNLLARLDPETGRLRDVLAAIGLDWQSVTHHPDTGRPFADFTIPDWDEAVALVLRASRAAPGLKIHSWDVAFTDAGPMLIEDNPAGDFVLVQLAADRGLATPRFMELYGGERI